MAVIYNSNAHACYTGMRIFYGCFRIVKIINIPHLGYMEGFLFQLISPSLQQADGKFY